MRVRIKFSKSGALIYTGNLDLHTMWERAVRRAGVPLAYSHGFHPQPKIVVAAPLPLGFASECELLDMRLNEDTDCEDLMARLNRALPEGIRVLSVEAVGEREPALPTRVSSAEYEIEFSPPVASEELELRVRELLAAEALPRERRGKPYDLRPLIEEMEVLPSSDGTAVRMHLRLRSQPGFTGRPDEVLDALGLERERARKREFESLQGCTNRSGSILSGLRLRWAGNSKHNWGILQTAGLYSGDSQEMDARDARGEPLWTEARLDSTRKQGRSFYLFLFGQSCFGR
jgi:radical SAM-linked protein